ncbi:NRAMP family divalent metal transporter [Rhizosphaericola mali]|uniref:Divalent metal cation transporter n=1 Tax=Rhizosphaericola mali TaxID=2545455 RepID=A0A5P2G6A0_9BACT|nr:divalent metal cation transporter [Rhizosphaericola mali]QES89452.1 divalent metal cation transporter [Rhizosphaericola mali]
MHKKSGRRKAIKFFKELGPGLVTGASDDDPSGIATYSQVGAQYGFATLWMAWFTFPLMAAMQKMCGKIGVVTQQGLTSTLKNHYPKWILWTIIILSLPAILLNIGADIEGMGAAANLIFPTIPAFLFSILFSGTILLSIILFSYKKIAKILKWTCTVLLVYLIVPFCTNVNWKSVIHATLQPHIQWNAAYINMMVAILGTTISPYLFFWQTTMETEGHKKRKNVLFIDKKVWTSMRKDIDFGMLFSNLVMFFIILTCGAVLYPNGITNITTVEQAALALKPIAGNFAYALFAIGIIGTGFLAIPVLCGSISYMVAEALNWKKGFNKKFYQAKPFYIVISISMLVGLCLHGLGISPIQALIFSSILYGITAPIVILVILHISNNKKIMSENTNGWIANLLGMITFLIMTIAAIALIYFQF